MSGANAESGSKLVIEAQSLFKTLGDKPLIQNFSTRILRGDRIDYRALMVRVKPHWFACWRECYPQILEMSDWEKPLIWSILINYVMAWNLTKRSGKIYVRRVVTMLWFKVNRRHVMAYLKDFLFEEKQVRSPVSILSGGEKNRLALAKALTRPGNLLIWMSQPTISIWTLLTCWLKWWAIIRERFSLLAMIVTFR